MGEFWQTLAAVALGGMLTLLTGYVLWKAERRAILREQRRDAIKTALSAVYDASNAINDYGMAVDQGDATLAARSAVRHAANEFLKRNMWLGEPFEERGALISQPMAKMEEAFRSGDHAALSQASETLHTNMHEVMAEYRAMLQEVDRQEAGLISKTLGRIRAARPESRAPAHAPATARTPKRPAPSSPDPLDSK